MFPKRVSAFLVIFVLSSPAYGVLVTSGYTTLIVYRDCSTTTCDSLNQLASLYYGDFSFGGESSLLMNDSSMPAGFQSPAYGGGLDLGSGSAVARPTGDIFAPEQKAVIDTVAGSVASAQGVTLQRYVNSSGAPIEVGLNVAIDWTISDPAPPSGSLTFGTIYQVQIFETPTGLVDLTPNPLFAPIDSDIAFSLALSGLFASPQGLTLYSSTEVAGVSGNDLLQSPLINLAAGEGFFVATRLIAFGSSGMTVDAFNSLRGTFVDENGNVLDGSGALRAVVVPEPGTLALFGAGLLAIALMRRRR